MNNLGCNSIKESDN